MVAQPHTEKKEPKVRSGRQAFPFTEILKAVGRTPAYVKLENMLDADTPGTTEITGLAGSVAPCILARFLQENLRPTLVLTATPEAADCWHEDLVHLLGEDRVTRFQSWEILPYEFRTPGPESTGRRLETLWRASEPHPPIVVTHLRAALEPTIPPETLRERLIPLAVGQTIPMEDLLARLVSLGYRSQSLVEEVATFSHRGGIVDIFTYSASEPIRIEFFGDTIESIRTFSVTSQRTTGQCEGCIILPSREVDALGTAYETGWENSGLESAWRDRVESEPDRPGLEWLAGTIGQKRARILDYYRDGALWWTEDSDILQSEFDRLIGEAGRFHDRLGRRLVNPPPPESLWGDSSCWQETPSSLHRVWMRTFRGSGNTLIDFGAISPPVIASSLERLDAELVSYAKDETDVTITCDNEGQRRRLQDLLSEGQTFVKLTYPSLHGGFVLPGARLALLTEHEIFHRHKSRYIKRRFQEGLAISSYTQLRKGDFVVHIDHGVGRFRGLDAIDVDGRRRDCLLLLYQDKDKLFVPIEEFDRVHKFTGKEGHPRLSKLGSTVWEKTKTRAKKALLDMADELIALYAERKSRPGFAFTAENEWIRQMEDSFIYEETPDQAKAIDSVRQDMCDPTPMDRLICGDVGYGKTEVAIRAAFRAVCDGKQVAVLVPTTILAQQHLTTFRERLSEFPVRIETLSRFRTPKEQKQVVSDLEKGTADIVIGTHRLLQKDISIASLGLLIVDEEQRFGVAHKEKLRHLQRRVDTLWLTATPIPRTLQMSLLGARDLSMINTSPRDRLPVITEVREFGPEVISEAIIRELDRGGQIYFVHNRVQTIAAMADYLHRLLPSLRIAVAHGQMPERELESVMVRFYHQEFDVLLCTSIIESGLDLPTVNTIILHRADRFGLAQLYQLRGRVGRSARQAYAYLLTPPFATLSTIANSRLKAIEEHTALGSGFHLAMRDLEIRGAGNLLGRQQHGFIEEVGFDLYCRMLDEAVAEAKGAPSALSDHPVPQIEVEGEKFIPDEYIVDSQQRFEMYKRMAEAHEIAAVDDLELEMTDRFGTPPTQAHRLLDLARARVLAQKAAVARAVAGGAKWAMIFDADAAIDRNRIGRWRDNLGTRASFVSGPPFRIQVRPELGASADLPGLLKVLAILAS